MHRSFLLLAALLALALGGCDSGKNSVKASPAPPTAIGTTSTVPTGVTAAAGDGQVTLAWSPIKGAVRYNAYWSTVSGAGTGGILLSDVASPFTQSGLINGVTYYYVVTEVGTAGEGPPSAQVSAKPSPVPAAPTGVFAFGGSNQVTVDWGAVSGAASYSVYWSTTKNAGTGGTRIMGAVPPFVHTNLTNGTPYYYVVTASNSTGEGPASAQVSATPFAAPPGPPPLPPGSLDPAFNGTGVVAFNITSPFMGTQDQGKAVVTDSLNRPLLLGFSSDTTFTTQHQTLSRWLISGAPDASFGMTPNVSAEPPFGGSNPLGGTSLYPTAMAQDPTGRLYVLSNLANGASTQFGFVVWRFQPSGLLDTSFNAGLGNIVVTNIVGGSTVSGSTLAVDSRGRIIVGGYMTDASFRQFATVWRFTNSGSSDPDFGPNSNGVTIQSEFGTYGTAALPGFSIGGFASPTDYLYSLVIDSQDRVLITGATQDPSGSYGIYIARLSAGIVGSPGTGGLSDTSFGDSLYNYTVVFNSLGGTSQWGYAVAQSATGQQYVAGFSYDNAVPVKSWMTVWGFANRFSAAAGFNVDGVLDPSFGTGGHASRNGAAGGTQDYGNAMAVDGAGRIVVAGQSQRPSGSAVMATWRLLANGAPDVSFATGTSLQPGSVWEPNVSGGTSDTGYALALDGLGRIVVAGVSFTTGNVNQQQVLWRLLP